MSNSFLPCTICQHIERLQTEPNPYLIHTFEHSVFVIGPHQHHKGYAQVILKQHVCDLHDLPAEIQRAHFQEVMLATAALVKTFQPTKMNHACYGNLDPHLHWHLFPRYQNDPDHQKQPFLHSTEFAKHLIDANTAQQLAAQVRMNLALP